MRKLTFRAEGLALRMIEAVSRAGERALHTASIFYTVWPLGRRPFLLE